MLKKDYSPDIIECTFELKESDISEDGSFKGYGSIFGNRDLVGDVVNKGAFKESIKRKGPRGIRMLWQHNVSNPIGYYTDVHEDKKGLYVEGQLILDTIKTIKTDEDESVDTGVPNVPDAFRVHALMKRKAIGGLSIGYFIKNYEKDVEWDSDKGIRYLNKLDLWEISPVTFPANTRAKITRVKDAGIFEAKTPRELEFALREAGIAKRMATWLSNRHDFNGRDVRGAKEILLSIRNARKRLEEI